MHKLPEYTQYNGERNIALLDNTSIAFMQQMQWKNFSFQSVLADYDVILIPGWVMTEVCDAEHRVEFINNLYDNGFPLRLINEKNYSDLMEQEDINLLNIVKAATYQYPPFQSYIRKHIQKADPLDLEDSAYWLPKMYDEWPVLGKLTTSGRPKKKNAGEISITILAEIFSYYYDDLNTLTVFSHDHDTKSFIDRANSRLPKDFPNTEPITITYKTNDFILCQLYHLGEIQLSDIDELRHGTRKVTYTIQKADKSVALQTEDIDNARFKELIQEDTVQIIF